MDSQDGLVLHIQTPVWLKDLKPAVYEYVAVSSFFNRASCLVPFPDTHGTYVSVVFSIIVYFFKRRMPGEHVRNDQRVYHDSRAIVASTGQERRT
jgi:hypothetical protein